MNVYRRSGRWRGPWRFCVGGLLVVLCSAPCRTSQAIATAQPRNVSVGGWRYTTSAPSRDWMHIDYRDAMWPLGEPGFGNQGLPPSEIHAEGLRNRLRGRMPFQTGRIEGSDENARRVADTEPAQ